MQSCYVCGEPTWLRCSGCNVVSYCGEEHSLKAWTELEHQLLCPVLLESSAVEPDALELDVAALPDISEQQRLEIGRRSSSHGLSSRKARYMLAREGKTMTPRQRRFMGWVAGGRKPRQHSVGLPIMTTEPEVYYTNNLRQDVLDNTDYRHVVSTTSTSQLVLMCITREDGGIEEEIHEGVSQGFHIDDGVGGATVDGVEYHLHSGVALAVPPGIAHSIEQYGAEPLRLSTIYSLSSGEPLHAADEVQKRRFVKK